MEPIYRIAATIITLINDIFVPLIFAVAFVFFLLGVFKYFFKGADSEDERKKGRDFVVSSVIGFFLMISIWGIVRLLTGTFGLDSDTRPCLPTFGSRDNCPGSQQDMFDDNGNRPTNLLEGTPYDGDPGILPGDEAGRDPIIY